MTDSHALNHSRPAETAGLDRLIERAEQEFQRRYDRPSRWIVAAPGRVNLIGEHTDYNGGFVLPMAIDGYTVIAADRAAPVGNDVVVRTHSALLEQSATLTVPATASPPATAHWSNYVLGVLAGYQALGISSGSFDAWIESSVPVGGGLSSSAALEVATATLVEAITGHALDDLTRVLLCQKAEHDYAHMPCGIMDQFTSVMARPDHLLLLDCRTQRADLVPFADPDVSVLIVNSCVKHKLASSEYAVRRRQCEEAAQVLGVAALRDATISDLEAAGDRLQGPLRQRARHVVSENERTVRAAKAIAAADWPQVGTLMYASHASLRDDYQVSCTELDLLVELATGLGEAAGVIGARMTGGGFGGCMVSLVRTASLPAVTAAIREGYRKATGIDPPAFATRAARGAHVIRGEG